MSCEIDTMDDMKIQCERDEQHKASMVKWWNMERERCSHRGTEPSKHFRILGYQITF